MIRRLPWRRRQSWQWSLLWYESFVKDEDVLVNEVYLWYEDVFDNLDNEVYLWYEDFLKDEDDLVNEVYLWYEGFLDNLDNEVYLWYEDFLEDKDVLEDEDCIEEEGYFDDENCLCKDVHWFLCNKATVDATI